MRLNRLRHAGADGILLRLNRVLHLRLNRLRHCRANGVFLCRNCLTHLFLHYVGHSGADGFFLRDNRVPHLTAHHFGHGLANLVLLRHDCLAHLFLRQILDGLVNDSGVKLGNQVVQHGGVVAGGQRRHFDAQRIQPRGGQLRVCGIQHSGKQLRRAVVESAAVAA